MRRSCLVGLAGLALVGCTDPVAPRPAPEGHPWVRVTAFLASTVLGPGDTVTVGYELENLTDDSLAIGWPTGCLIVPQVAQVAGPRMKPPPVFGTYCTQAGSGLVLAPRERRMGQSVLFRGFDPTLPVRSQRPGYLLTRGVFDVSVVLHGTELGRDVQSPWVRLVVR